MQQKSLSPRLVNSNSSKLNLQNSKKRNRTIKAVNQQQPEIMTARVIGNTQTNSRIIYKQNADIIKKWSNKNRSMSLHQINTSRYSVFSPLSNYLESIDEHSNSSYNSLSCEMMDESNLTQRQKQSLFFKDSKKDQQLLTKSKKKMSQKSF